MRQRSAAATRRLAGPAGGHIGAVCNGPQSGAGGRERPHYERVGAVCNLRSAICNLLLLLLLIPAAAAQTEVPLDGFEDVGAWQARPDGGQPPAFSAEKTLVKEGKGAMRVVYRNGEKGWGNLQRPITLPAPDGSLAFWVNVVSAAPEAAMHVWLEEPDGDMWVVPVTEGGEGIGRWAKGWHHVVLPLRRFRFDGRGNNRREREKVVRMLLGCNFGDFVAVIDGLTFLPAAAGRKEPPLVDRQTLFPGEAGPAVERMLGAGWYDGEGKELGRWTGKEGKPAEMRLSLVAGREYQVTLRGIVPQEKWQKKDIAVTVDGRPAENLQVDAASGTASFRIGAGAARQVTVALATGTFVPGAGDTRALGMKVTAVDVAAFPRSDPNLKIERTAKGSIAILRDELPRSGAPSDPEYLGKLLRAAGYGVTFVRALDLVNPLLLTRTNFDLLVLPYGPVYPADGREALVAYLKGGGAFLSTGGYAFNQPVVYRGGKWVLRAEDPEGEPDPNETPINTSRGKQQDAMVLNPEQIGAFDPSYPLKDAVRAVAAPGQFVAPPNLQIAAPAGGFEGFAAAGMFGSNSPVFPKGYARWIPLLDAKDTAGRQRGALGALALHYDGPFAGSGWGFFGVTNADLFAVNGPGAPLLLNTVDALLRRTFLHSLRPGFFCYRAGESVKVGAAVRNAGSHPVRARVRFTIEGLPACEVDAGEIPAGQEAQVHVEFPPFAFTRDLYRIGAVLLLDGRPADEMDSAFVAWDPKVIAAGPRIDLRDNYFRINGRPAFLCGTNQTGMLFASAFEDPLVWDRDLAQMSDNGVNIMRVLHFSPFATTPTTRNPLDLRQHPEALVRQTDALVQLCQKHGVALFLSLHDWMNLGLSDAELAAQRDWAQFWAGRYRDVPGIFYDIQNEPQVDVPDSPDVRREWNAFLKKRYGTDDALRAAWAPTPPEKPLGEIPVAMPKGGWASVAAHDYALFRVEVLNRWVKANADGIHAGAPNALCTVGYLQNIETAEKPMGTRYTDFSNMHSYLYPNDLPKGLKFIDRRFEGKSFSLGEFGAKCHPAWSPGPFVGVSEAAAGDYFLRVGHYTLGLGASFMANWSWKDMIDCVFPWGIVHPGDGVPKDDLPVYRNMSLFFRLFRPRYTDPGLYYLLPDSNRLGGALLPIHNALLDGIDGLIGCRVAFNVANEYDLDRLPATARTVIWPIPYCPDDQTYARVKEFVQRGGTLLVTGDLSYDAMRRRTRAGRLEELCGVRAEAPATGAPDLRAAVAVVPAGAERVGQEEPALYRYKVGQGTAYYTPAPVEMDGAAGGVYARFLALAGVKPEPVDAPPAVQVLPVGMQEPGRAWALYNTGREPAKLMAGNVSLTLGPARTGFVRLDGEGKLLAVEGDGPVAVAGKPVLEIAGHAMVASLDGRPLDASRALLLLPVHAGSVRLPDAAGWREPVVQAGEFRQGRWTPLATTAAADGAVPVPEERRNDMFLFCERADAAEWAAVMEKLLRFR